MTKRIVLLMVLVCLTGILSTANVWAEPDAAAIQKLYEAAKAEGEVLWQVGGRLDSIVPVAKEFEKKYPGIKVKPFSSSASGIAARVITEAAAGKMSLDVGETMTARLTPLLDRDLLIKYDWSKITDIDPSLILADGRVLIHMDHCPVWVYNTNLVSEKDIPKTWDDVLDPKWQGSKIGMRAMGAALGGLFRAWEKDPQKTEAYLEKLAAQKPVPSTRYSLVMKRVTSGETPLASVMGAEVKLRQSQGAPIKALPISPTANSAMTHWIPKAAPHPNAAKLLASWLVSKEGSKIRTKFTKGGYAYPPDASPLAETLHENNIEYSRIVIGDADNFNRYSQIVEKIMGFTIK